MALANAVLRSVIHGKFRTKDISNSPFGRAYHQKDKSGKYHERQSRRLVNEQFRDVFSKVASGGADSRKMEYTSVFAGSSTPKAPVDLIPNSLWGREADALLNDDDQRISVAFSSFIYEYLPEVWRDRHKFRIEIIEMMKGMPRGDDGLYALVWREVDAWSDIFLVLYNHISAPAEINWFMRKRMDRRARVLSGQYAFAYGKTEFEEVLQYLETANSQHGKIADMLILGSASFAFFQHQEISLALLDRGIECAEDKSETCLLLIEKATLLREMKRYQDMLTAGEKAVEVCKSCGDLFSEALASIRCAEAKHYSGDEEAAIDLLNEVESLQERLNGSYVPSMRALSFSSKKLLKEDSIKPNYDEIRTPLRIALYVNLIAATRRMGNCRLEMHFMEVLLSLDDDYFKTVEGTSMFISLSRRYSVLLFSCR